jgi:hypothetical protein
MKRLVKTTIGAVVAGAALLVACLGLAAAAAAYTLNLSAPPTGVVGQAVVIQATGLNPPPSEFWALSWIEAAAIPTSAVGACPADGQSAIQIATSGVGELLAIAMRPNLDSEGKFSNSLAWLPAASGAWLVCAYQDDGAGLTLAQASASIQVASAPTAPPPPPPPPASPGSTPAPPPTGTQPNPGQAPAARPANLARPSLTRSGRRLTCRPGKWSNVAAGYSYSWLVNGKAKHGVTGSALRMTHALWGARVQCEVTASGPGGRASALSRPLRIG